MQIRTPELFGQSYRAVKPIERARQHQQCSTSERNKNAKEIARDIAATAGRWKRDHPNRFSNLMCGLAEEIQCLRSNEEEACGNPSGLAATIYRAAQKSRIYVSNRDRQSRPKQTVTIRRGPYTSSQNIRLSAAKVAQTPFLAFATRHTFLSR